MLILLVRCWCSAWICHRLWCAPDTLGLPRTASSCCGHSHRHWQSLHKPQGAYTRQLRIKLFNYHPGQKQMAALMHGPNFSILQKFHCIYILGQRSYVLGMTWRPSELRTRAAYQAELKKGWGLTPLKRNPFCCITELGYRTYSLSVRSRAVLWGM